MRCKERKIYAKKYKNVVRLIARLYETGGMLVCPNAKYQAKVAALWFGEKVCWLEHSVTYEQVAYPVTKLGYGVRFKKDPFRAKSLKGMANKRNRK